MIDRAPHIQESQEFPTVNFLVKLYTIGALASIALAFVLPLEPTQVTVCLAVGWLLTSVGLVMSVFVDLPEEETEDEL